MEDQKIIESLKNGGVGVLATDTVYGIVACASNKDAVEKIYVLKERPTDRALIVLINSIDDIEQFNAHLNQDQVDFLRRNWPGKVSVVISCDPNTFQYIHRGQNSIAFRLPSNVRLQNILRETGPLVAPSANKSGLPTARNITEARGYFGDAVDFYDDHGELTGDPSTLVSLLGDRPAIIRQGAAQVV